MGKRQLTTKVGTAVVAVSAWVGYPFLLPLLPNLTVVNTSMEFYLKHELPFEIYIKQKLPEIEHEFFRND